jgi:hypothetical protein
MRGTVSGMSREKRILAKLGRGAFPTLVALFSLLLSGRQRPASGG